MPLRLVQVKFHIGKWKCSRDSWVVMRHQIYGFLTKKNPRSAELMYTFCEVEFRQKKAEMLVPNIESAVHSTKPEDEFRLGKGLNTKFRREFFSAEVRYTICVVEFRWKPIYTKVRKNCLQSIRGHKISIFRRFFSADLMPIIGRKKKDRKVRKDLFGKKIWDFNAKFWTLDPTLPCGHGWHMWSGGTCLGNPLGNSCGLGNGQCNHPLPSSGPMLFESSMERGFCLSIFKYSLPPSP